MGRKRSTRQLILDRFRANLTDNETQIRRLEEIAGLYDMSGTSDGTDYSNYISVIMSLIACHEAIRDTYNTVLAEDGI